MDSKALWEETTQLKITYKFSLKLSLNFQSPLLETNTGILTCYSYLFNHYFWKMIGYQKKATEQFTSLLFMYKAYYLNLQRLWVFKSAYPNWLILLMNVKTKNLSTTLRKNFKWYLILYVFLIEKVWWF